MRKILSLFICVCCFLVIFPLSATAAEYSSLKVSNEEEIILSETLIKQISPICAHHDFAETEKSKDATCTEDGIKHFACKKCGFEKTEVIKAIGHKLGQLQTISQPSCTLDGLKQAFCQNCPFSIKETIPAIGHNFGKLKKIADPSCEAIGRITRICKNCQEVENYDFPALGHEFKEFNITTEPTISQYGVKTGYCTRCNTTTSEKIECAQTDTETNISFTTSFGVFPEGTELKVLKIPGEGKADKSIKKSLAHITNDFLAYKITSSLNSSAPQPKGDVIATFPIPEGFGRNVAVYYIEEEGSVKKLTSTVSEDGLSVASKMATNGTYAVCKLGFGAESAAKKGLNINPIALLVLSIIAILIVWGVVLYKIFKVRNPYLIKRIIANTKDFFKWSNLKPKLQNFFSKQNLLHICAAIKAFFINLPKNMKLVIKNIGKKLKNLYFKILKRN